MQLTENKPARSFLIELFCTFLSGNLIPQLRTRYAQTTRSPSFLRVNRANGVLETPKLPRKRPILIGNETHSHVFLNPTQSTTSIFLIGNEFTLCRRSNSLRLCRILTGANSGAAPRHTVAKTRFCAVLPLRCTFSRTRRDRAERAPKLCPLTQNLASASRPRPRAISTSAAPARPSSTGCSRVTKAAR